jgi:hypothetical protein
VRIFLTDMLIYGRPLNPNDFIHVGPPLRHVLPSSGLEVCCGPASIATSCSEEESRRQCEPGRSG